MEKKQTLTITVEFKEKHNPGTEQQLKQILHPLLKSKGLDYDLRDNKIRVWKQKTGQTVTTKKVSSLV